MGEFISPCVYGRRWRMIYKDKEGRVLMTNAHESIAMAESGRRFSEAMGYQYQWQRIQECWNGHWLCTPVGLTLPAGSGT